MPVTGFTAVAPNAPHYLGDALINGKTVQRWHDQTQVINVNIQTGQSVAGWNPQMITLVKQAFTEWQTALNGRIRFNYTNDPTKTDVTIKWRRNLPGTEVGVQKIRWHDNILTDADIEIAVHNPQGKPLTQREIQYVALHEIGHMLGIKGHSANPNDIMYASVQPRVTHLTARDKNTITALYKQKAHITNPPGVALMQYRLYEYHIRLGYDAHQQNRFEAAYNYFVKAKGHYKNDPQIDYFIGLSAYNSRKYPAAIEHLTKASTRPGENQGNATYFLANSLMAMGSNEIAGGKKASGMQKIHQARTYYSSIVKNPKAPSDLKKMANANLSKLATVAL